MNYSFDSEKWLNQVLGFHYRKFRLIKWLNAIIAPIQSLHNNFLLFRSDILFKKSYTCQQKSLAALLNRVFKDNLGGKYFNIVTTSEVKKKYYHPIASDGSGLADNIFYGLSDEPSPFQLYYGLADDYNDSTSFIVYTPTGCAARIAEVKAWVNYYRFASKDFKIVYI